VERGGKRKVRILTSHPGGKWTTHFQRGRLISGREEVAQYSTIKEEGKTLGFSSSKGGEKDNTVAERTSDPAG